MKRLFRDRKPSLDSKTKPLVSPPAPLAASETPLFTRYASGSRGTDGGSSSPTKHSVSGPMQLSAKTSLSRRGSRAVVAPDGGGREAQGYDKMLSRTPSRTVQEAVKPKVNPSSATRYPSRPELGVAGAMSATLASASPQANQPRHDFSFPSAQTVNSTDSSSYHRNSSNAFGRARTVSSTSDSSDPSSYAPSPRMLVVRNQDPSSASLSRVSFPRGPTNHYYELQHVPSTSSFRNSSAVFSPPPEIVALVQTGFDLGEPDYSEAVPAYPRPSIWSPATGGPTSPSHRPSASASVPRRQKSFVSGSYSQQVQPSPVHPQAETASHQQEPARHNIYNNSAPRRQTSLLSTPSVTRRKYSPMAAFGLPQASPNASFVVSPSSDLAHADEQLRYSAARSIAREPDLPSLPPLDVSSSSFHLSHMDTSSREWREQTSRRASRVSISERTDKTDYGGLPSPSSPDPDDNLDANEDGSARRRFLNDATISASRPTSVRHAEDHIYPAPIPIRPQEEPGALSSRLSASLASNSMTIPPTQAILDSASADMSDIDDPRLRPTYNAHHAAPPDPRAARPVSYREDDSMSSIHPAASTGSLSRHSPTPQHAGPIRGRPLIFAAMEATATSEAHNIDVEPEVLGFIGDLSAAAKTEEGYSAYAYGHQTSYQTPNATPPPPPEKDAQPRHRKLSKPRRHQSSRMVDTTSGEAENDRHGSARRGSWRATPPRHADTVETQRALRSISPQKAIYTTNELTAQSGSVADMQDQQRRSNDSDRHGRKKSISQDPKVHRSSRDAVKPLTDRQMEKLNNRLSYGGGPMRQPEPEPQVQPARRPVPDERSAALPPPPHKLSYKSTAPFIPMQAAQPPSSQIPDTKRSHHSGKLSASHGSLSRQLPTPPDEAAPSWSRRDRRRRKSPSPDYRDDHGAVWQHENQAQEEPAQEEPPAPQFYPLHIHVADSIFLEQLLVYLSYYEWLTLTCVSKEIRRALYDEGREVVLERYLRTVGYTRWHWDTPEPLVLAVEDLCHYMRGVSLPAHQYSMIASSYLQPRSLVQPRTMQELTFACRAFTRVVLRLRVQAEAEATHNARSNGFEMSNQSRPHMRERTNSSSTMAPHPSSKWSSQSTINNVSRTSSRAPSPSPSNVQATPRHQSAQLARSPSAAGAFHSPLYRLRRAPLLQVFVPSPEGDWLSDASILECEAELKRAGVTHLLRAGDVVWDMAVGDEANVGRMVWDGTYLIDLDYTYTRVGDAPRYLPSLAFPPSYFHRVIRTMGTGNPIVRIDLALWADQINENLQLLQDKMKTDTPQGGKHTVVQWVHRSSFVIRPAPGTRYIRLPMPSTAGPGPSPTGAWVIDPSWYGTVVVETEGTNEGRADLLARCRAPYPRRGPTPPEEVQIEERRQVFRIMRERSRPGEIWVRLVTDKERLLPL